MSLRLTVRNRQRTRRVDTRWLRRIISVLLRDLLPAVRCDLGIYLLDSKAIARLNEQFLNHRGPTDVIAFDYADSGREDGLHGEIFICLDEAVRQARHYRVTWPDELVRYLVHGLLHLNGYDDHRSRERRRMKHREDLVVRALRGRLDLARLAPHP